MTTLDTFVRDATWSALDFESSGATEGQSDEPVQVGMASWSVVEGFRKNFFRSYIRTVVSITPSASAVHHIGDDALKNAPTMLVLWPEFKARLNGAVIVAHGAGTEKRFLRGFPMHGFSPWMDTLALSRAVLPNLQDHSLGFVVTTLGLEAEVRELCPTLDWHDALFDAVACLVLLRHLINRLNLQTLTIGQMQQLDKHAYYRQLSLRKLL